MSWYFTKARRITKRRKLSPEAQAILDRLGKYLHDNSAEPVEILCGFWKDQQDAITYQELRKLVEEGYLDEVTARLWEQDYSVLVKERMPKIWNHAIIAGAASQPLMERTLGAWTFNTQTPGVMRWIQSRGAYMVTVSTQTQKDAIALLLEDKMRNGHTVDELARLIRPCVGLYRQQASAVSNYYDSLIKSLTEQHPRTKPARIQAMALDKATKYAERLHRQRAMMIAQTEMAFAYNYGADEGIRQAQADFLIGKCIKRWSTAGDDNVCDACRDLDGTEIGMDELFYSGSRVVYEETGLYPPLHPRCACAVQYIEVETPKIPQKPLANPPDGGIMNDIVQRPDGTMGVIGHEVTDSTIQNIPKVNPEGWDAERVDKLQTAHQELLRDIKDLPLGTEKVCYYRADMQPLDSLIGEAGSGSVAAAEFAGEYISMHNHATGLIFSDSDIENFISDSNMVMASVVGNNGKVYLLQKLDNYEAANFLKGLIRLENDLKPFHNLTSDEQIQHAQEIVDLVEDFLKGAEQYGVKFITGG